MSAAELRQNLLTERLEEARLVLADVVQVQLVEAELEVLVQPRRVPLGVGGHPDDPAYRLDRHVLADLVEDLRGVDVPYRRRGKDVAAPLVVCERLRAWVVA